MATKQTGSADRATASCDKEGRGGLPVEVEVAGGLRVRVRTAEEPDINSVITMVTEDGWVENVCEYSAIFSADPNCWLVAENANTGEVLGHCCGLTVGQDLAAVHTYITAPHCRRRGVGSCLWSRLMHKFQDRTLILSSVDHNVPMYARLGLRPLYKWKVLEGPIVKENLPTPNDSDHILTSELQGDSPTLGEVQAFDREVSMSGRPRVLHTWVSHQRSKAVVARHSSSHSLLGYGVLFRAHDKWYLSPLYAETEAAAWRIAQSLLEDVANGDVVVTYTPAANEKACSVWEAAGLRCHTLYNLMTGDAQDMEGRLQLNKVFSMISTASFGYV